MQIYNRTNRQRMRYLLGLTRTGRMTTMDLWSAVMALTFVAILLLNGGK